MNFKEQKMTDTKKIEISQSSTSSLSGRRGTEPACPVGRGEAKATYEKIGEAKATYEKILSLFVNDNALSDHFTRNPFLIGSKAAASNRVSLVAVPKWRGYYPDKTKELKSVYPIESNCHISIPVSAIKEAYEKIPWLDDFDETKEECGACDGDGEVEYEYKYDGDTYETEEQCPVCDGSGYRYVKSNIPNGKKISNPGEVVKILDHYFNARRLEELIKVADLLNAHSVAMTFQNPKLSFATHFRIKQVDLVLMSCTGGPWSKPCAEIL